MYQPLTTPDLGPLPGPLPIALPRMGRVLVVEEDLARRRAIVSYLADRQCTAFGCGTLDVTRHIQAQPLSLVMLDSRHGSSSGLDTLSQIRRRSNVPVILYGDGHQVDADRIVGLELGADDFLSGPLNLHELLVRARAVLRRQELGRLVGRSLRGGYRFNGWELRHPTRELMSPKAVLVKLTKKEYALLVALLEMPGRVLSRLHLMRATRAHEDIYDRSIDVQILRLRRKLEGDPSGIELIKTERGVGYMLDAHVENLH
jgi:two-component system OmpR family response regulator